MQTKRTKTGYQLGNIHVDAKPFSRLPTQQARTLLFIATGLPQKNIAEQMGVTVNTIKKACMDLGYRFNTYSMRETVHTAIQQGVLRYSLCIALCLLSAFGQYNQRCFRSARTTRTARTTRSTKRDGLTDLLNDFLTA